MKTKRLNRRLGAFGAGLMLVIGSVAIGAPPANAAVFNCSTGYNTSGAFAKCLTADNPTTDKYRVRVLCQNVFTKASRSVYGNWVTVQSNKPSILDGCGAFEAFYGTPYASNS